MLPGGFFARRQRVPGGLRGALVAACWRDGFDCCIAIVLCFFLISENFIGVDSLRSLIAFNLISFISLVAGGEAGTPLPGHAMSSVF